jgi:hypothetical protein
MSVADRERGQATVELVALLPLVLAVALVAATILTGQAAAEQAGQAAEAGAIAALQGGDPEQAAERAIPAGGRSRATVTRTGTRITVTLRPRVPLGFPATALEASATADIGPEPVP